MTKLKKSGFTKKPWQLSYFEHKFYIHIKNSPKNIIARVGSMQTGVKTTKEIEANAHLMVSAPKLADGLEEAIQAINTPKHKELRKKLMLILRQAKGPL